MAVISMKQLLEAGVHFGHKQEDGTRKWLHTFSLSVTVFILSIYKKQ